MTVACRLATAGDGPALKQLNRTAARGLSADFYSPRQTESAITFIVGVDSQLIAGGTYFGLI